MWNTIRGLILMATFAIGISITSNLGGYALLTIPLIAVAYSVGAFDGQYQTFKGEVLLAVDNEIKMYFHCAKCLEEANGEKYDQRISCGWTKAGFQVWCKVHDENIISIDFDGQKVKLVKAKDVLM